ncbi:hypothetical protein [Spirosoma validum]|uniref:Uncharacterized protein n=1 Tax=Spirosoma validum TaxID=2771355 RepID=A0A927AZA0_9BACT|nr:hypothetical protein [Spirosoma validum]MBD2752615.1 hypothetical protein [Spirosoma validum]
MSDKEKNELWATAMHEAAHLVIAITGYECEGITVSYYDKPLNDIPVAISIVRKDDSSGYNDVPSDIERADIKSLQDKHRQSRHIVRILAGFAVEESCELSPKFDIVNEFYENRGNLAGGHDFNKVARILYDLIDYEAVNFDDIYFSNVQSFWGATLAILQTPSIRKAICITAKTLMVKKTMYVEDLKRLRTRLEFTGLDKCCISLPPVQLTVG